MPKVLIIGYGNPLRGDDGVGWVIAENLKETLSDEKVLIKTCIQLTPELAADLSDSDFAILIDARAEEPAGAISYQQVEPLPVLTSSSHHFTPASLLSYAYHLFGKAPKTYLVSINGAEFGYQERLSLPVQKAITKAIQIILEIIGKLE
ncbi:MAG: hydrogenase maturation protease [Armatimonadetes bacterium]|nr:hydrogenase maturation protease [Armatimonadota bacterium]MDW8027420.1 hydrogenase maturation protease [Armatimonadota bacterium]